MFLPYGVNSSINATSEFWRPDPSTRGTFSILTICVINMSICIWSALHLNIPEYGSTSSRLLSQMSWVLLGLLVPEMIARTAFQQRREANRLLLVMRSSLGQAPPQSAPQKFFKRICRYFSRRSRAIDHHLNRPENQAEELSAENLPNRHLWTMWHSHYALMGGFAFDACNMDVNVLPHGKQRLFLSPTGLEYLAKLDISLLPDVSEEDIRAKSKRGGLGKFIVCVQAFWFCVECLVRLANGLSISVLELNALDHALCTFVIFWMWWNKPYDVEASTLISGDKATEIAALFSTFGDVSKDIPVLFTPQDNNKQQHEHFEKWTTRLHYQALHLFAPQSSGESAKCKLELLNGFTRLDIGENLHGFSFDAAMLKAPFSTWAFPPRYFLSHLCCHVDLSPHQKFRFEKAQGAIERFKLAKDHLTELESQGSLLVWQVSNYSPSTQLDIQAKTGYDDTVGVTDAARGYIPATILFGLLYLTAWDAPLLPLAQIFWRVEVTCILTCGLFFLVCCPFMSKAEMVRDLAYGFVCWSIIGRFVLLVVAFSSLWWLPDSVYEVTSWSQYFPHIAKM